MAVYQFFNATLSNSYYFIMANPTLVLALEGWYKLKGFPVIVTLFILLLTFVLGYHHVVRSWLFKKPFGQAFLQSQLQKERKELERHVFATPLCDAVWEIGTTWKSCSVAEEGVIRAFEFTPQQGEAKLDVDHIVATLIKAIVEPVVGSGDPPVKQRPRVAHFLYSTPLPTSMIHQVAASMIQYGIKVYTRAEVEKELPALEAKRRMELVMSAGGGTGVAKRSVAKPVMSAQPPRGCFLCKKEIADKKPSQCSACKAVIYCGAECAKKDWPTHKVLCPLFKEHMSHFSSQRMHQLPFPWYPEGTPLCNYNAVAFLVGQGLHNVGIYKRLCKCFAAQPYGDLWLADLQALTQMTLKEEGISQFLGLNKSWFPLSSKGEEGEWKDGLQTKDIMSWANLYKAKGVDLADPAALILHVPMTIWGAYQTFVKQPLSVVGGRNKLTIHLVGAEKEADIMPGFEILLSLFPAGSDLVLHLVGDKLTEQPIPPYKARNENLDSTLIVTVTHSLYKSEHLSGEAFRQAGHVLSAEQPDFVMIQNASLMHHTTWPSTVQLLVQSGTKTIITEPMEQAAEAVAKQLKTSGMPITDVSFNPFRMPLFQFTQDVNLPAFDNGFWYAFH